LVVCRLNGQGADVGSYLAFMTLSDLVDLLVKAGYDKLDHELTDKDIKRCKQCGEWTINNPCNWCEDQ
jgi:recombinational DNA repair protein RecR